MKRIVAVLSVIILLCMLCCSVDATSDHFNQNNSDAFEDARVLKFIPIGNDFGEIGYSAKDDWTSGPEAFIYETGMQPHDWVQSSTNYVCSVCGAVMYNRAVSVDSDRYSHE